MRPSKLTVYELFQQQKRYAVPLYQRPYVWNEQDNWAPLWEDISSKATAIRGGRSYSPHFLGAIVLQQIPVFGKQLACAQVIDGQQRLTTLQVLLAVVRNRVAAALQGCTDEERRILLGDITDDLRALTQHRGVMETPIEKFKVWPTNEDRTVFQAVMTAPGRAELDQRYPIEYEGKRKKTPKPGPGLVEAYRFFDRALGEFAAEMAVLPAAGVPVDIPEFAILDALKNALHLVVIELEDRDDPQVIFETLNARGTRLLPSDLIRNFVFTEAVARKESSDELYMQLWRHFDERASDETDGFWKQEVKVGREKRPRLDLFLQHYLVCKSETEVALPHLYEDFKKFWKSRNGGTVQSGLEELRRFGEAWHDFQEPARVADERVRTFLLRLAVLDNSTLMPLLLFLFAERKDALSDQQRSEILGDIESYLVRRWICGLTTKNYNRFFVGLLHEIRASPTFDASDVRRRLVAASGDSRWPSDRDVERAWLHEPLYQRLDSAGIQMLLEAVQDELLTSKQEKVRVLQRLTVEHVLPRGWRESWAAPAPDLATPEETPEERRDRSLHTLGNLTLLTQPLNSAISNGPFVAKRPEITKQSLLFLNSYFQEAASWDEDAIAKRGEFLLAAAKRVWALPASPAA